MSSSDDRLDALVAQWRSVRPDLDPSVMAEVARILHVARLISAELALTAAEHDLQIWEADVLFTLFRAGAPHRLSPSALAESTLVTSGTMTSRLDKLERRGLVRRLPNPDDRRGLAVELTDRGRALADGVVAQHVSNEHEMLSVLTMGEREQVGSILRKLHGHLEARAATPPR